MSSRLVLQIPLQWIWWTTWQRRGVSIKSLLNAVVSNSSQQYSLSPSAALIRANRRSSNGCQRPHPSTQSKGVVPGRRDHFPMWSTLRWLSTWWVQVLQQVSQRKSSWPSVIRVWFWTFFKLERNTNRTWKNLPAYSHPDWNNYPGRLQCSGQEN